MEVNAYRDRHVGRLDGMRRLLRSEELREAGGWKEPDEFPSEGSSEKRTILAIEIVIDRRLGTVSMQMSMNVSIGSYPFPRLPGSVASDM